jgi:hypothetical protein
MVQSDSSNDKGEKSSPGVDNDSSKKSTEWVLEPWAHKGVVSTTRYRKPNPLRRSAQTSSSSKHLGPTSSGYHHQATLASRSSSGRKGGITASKGISSREHSTESRIQAYTVEDTYYYSLPPHDLRHDDAHAVRRGSACSIGPHTPEHMDQLSVVPTSSAILDGVGSNEGQYGGLSTMPTTYSIGSLANGRGLAQFGAYSGSGDGMDQLYNDIQSANTTQPYYAASDGPPATFTGTGCTDGWAEAPSTQSHRY